MTRAGQPRCSGHRESVRAPLRVAAKPGAARSLHVGLDFSRRWRIRLAVMVAVGLVAVGGLAYRAYDRARDRGAQAERDLAKEERWTELVRKRDSEGLNAGGNRG